MGSYLDRIKASNPDAYNKIADLAKYSANENYGGTPQDWQAQIFTKLDANAPKSVDLSNQEAITKQGLIPVPVGQDSEGNDIYGFEKSLGTINGVPVSAQYDASGNLTGYQGDTRQRNFLDGSHSVSGKWDVNGNPTPTQYQSGGGGFLGSVAGGLGDIWSSLGPVGQIAALYYGGSALGEALGGAEAGGTNLFADQAIPGNAADLAGYGGGTAFTGELPAGYAGYTAPVATTLGTVAGPTEGMGTALSDVGATENAYTAAQDAQDALAMQGNPAANATLGSVAGIGAANAYPALNAAAGAGAAGSALGSLTGTALGDMALVSGATGLGSALIGSTAAQNAADVQAAAANKSIAQQQANFNTINAQQAPYRAAGYGALNQLANLGSGQTQQYDAQGNVIGATANPSDYLTHQFNAADLAAGLAPNYNFMLQQGQMANQRAANAAGGGLSGNALQGLQKYTQDYAGNAYQNAFNNYQTQRQNIYNTLAGIAGIGQTGQTATNTAATNATNAATQLGVGSAAAQAGATAGTGNAYANALNQVGQNYTLASLLNQRGNVQMPTA